VADGRKATNTRCRVRGSINGKAVEPETKRESSLVILFEGSVEKRKPTLELCEPEAHPEIKRRGECKFSI
jgi:hypothetical protein